MEHADYIAFLRNMRYAELCYNPYTSKLFISKFVPHEYEKGYIMLELAGMDDRDRVKLGTVADNRNPQKSSVPTSKLPIAHSFEGKISTHTFTLGDATSMKANVSPQLERLFDFRFEILDFRF